jgi:excisionase family DNA binding protein
MPKRIRICEAAKLVGVSRQAVYGWVREGRLKAKHDKRGKLTTTIKDLGLATDPASKSRV